MPSRKALEAQAMEAVGKTPVEPQWDWQPSVKDQEDLFAQLARDRVNLRNDAQVSRALALAIGYLEEDVSESYESAFYNQDMAEDATSISVRRNGMWCDFDFRDPSVIFAIAERYDCFPRRSAMRSRWVSTYRFMRTSTVEAGQIFMSATPAGAIAKTVIEVAKLKGGVWKIEG